MSIHFSGAVLRSSGTFGAIIKQLKCVNLMPVKRINIRFDPFNGNSKQTRDFLYFISGSKVRATNPQCALKTEVLCDRSEPTITFDLQSGEKVVFKTALLTTLNVLELYNKHITSLIPPDPAKLEAEKERLEKERKKKKRPHHRIKLWSKRRGVTL
ncbi:hypothetical protein P5V15_006703 [Pogonomyrmex californicus]